MKKNRFFYFGMINTDALHKKLKEPIEIAAASNKMISILNSIRLTQSRAFLVSAPVLGRNCRVKFMPGCVLRDNGVPQIILPVFSNAYLRKIIAFFSFAWFCFKKVKSNDRVILFNHALEYLLGLLILTFKGNLVILDIEDMPCDNTMGFLNWIDRKVFCLFYNLTAEKKIVVSSLLADRLKLKKFCVTYGAVRINEKIKFSNKFSTKAPLKILYGGTLISDTGLDIFCDAVKLIANTLILRDQKIHFVITGFGGSLKINNLKNYCKGSRVRIIYSPSTSYDDYIHQLSLCDVGLSLKIPNREITLTTFPSKVVEITTNGLLLISTKASDVPKLFDSRTAILLKEPTANCLHAAIISALRDKMGMKKIAMRGKNKAMKLFDPKIIGMQIINFIEENN